MAFIKSKESHPEIKPRSIDIRQRLSELQAVRTELANIRNELFTACCNLQGDPSSLDPGSLSLLAFRARALEKEGSRLEEIIAVLQTGDAAD